MEFLPPFGGIWNWYTETQSHEGAPDALEAARSALMHRSWVKKRLMFLQVQGVEPEGFVFKLPCSPNYSGYRLRCINFGGLHADRQWMQIGS